MWSEARLIPGRLPSLVGRDALADHAASPCGFLRDPNFPLLVALNPDRGKPFFPAVCDVCVFCQRLQKHLQHHKHLKTCCKAPNPKSQWRSCPLSVPDLFCCSKGALDIFSSKTIMDLAPAAWAIWTSRCWAPTNHRRSNRDKKQQPATKRGLNSSNMFKCLGFELTYHQFIWIYSSWGL